MPLDFFLAFSPEREDPGNKQYGLAQIPKVVGGINPPAAARRFLSTVRSLPASFPSALLAPRKWPSCSKTSSDASTSPWSTN